MEMLNTDIIQDAYNKGKFIGKQTPCLETKGAWYEVYQYENKLIACVFSPHLVCGHEIDPADLFLYIE